MQNSLPNNGYQNGYTNPGSIYPKKGKSILERLFPFFERHEIRFILLFSLFFLATVTLLTGLGLVPSEFQEDSGQASLLDQAKNAAIQPLTGNINAMNLGVNANTSQNLNNQSSSSSAYQGNNQKIEYPVRIVIASVKMDGKVTNPSSSNVDVLDNALTLGAVRYPGSGVPGLGNMFIFGHSTGFKIVQNKAYKIFNTIKNAKAGDEVKVYGDKNIYFYKVISVEEVNKDKTLVNFDTNGPAMLTLSTCDSFGEKSDRFVVKALFDRVEAIKL